jgi:8-oxo-dGTP pyrophosphatase MutT (NUDIX family)
MYKVFFNDNFLILSTSYPENTNFPVEKYHSFSQLDEWLNKCKISEVPVCKVIIADDIDKIWQQWISKFPIIDAAGGLVLNNEGKYLFIYRRKRWDLPKGKMDAGETPEQTALREVTEETGLSPLRLEDFICNTFHFYFLNKTLVLKRTYWFEMKYEGNQPPVPQTSEDIEIATWLSLEEFSMIKEPMFPSILEVLKAIEA